MDNTAATVPEAIRIRGARVHNLQNVDLDIPRDKLVVITGLSGSGKSSLAFDTVFAEGQRQYIESLSTYARQFLVQLERADVDLIDGLQPTISVDQRAGSLNPRSTVATATEIYDYLRLLYARVGEAHCPQCGEVVRQQSPEQIVDDVLQMPERTKVMVLAPFIRGRKGQHKEVFEAIRKAGFVRARVDGEVLDIDAMPELVRQKNHDIEAVVDRIVVREGVRPRIAESVQLAIKYSEGVVLVTYLDPSANAADPSAWQNRLFSTQNSCPNCKLSFEELEPRSFSFNSPYGACPACEGLGYRVEFDPELVVPDASRSLSAGVVAPWRTATQAAEPYVERVAEFLTARGYRRNTPWESIKPKDYEQLLRGDGEFHGLVTLLEQQLVTTTSAKSREQLETYRGDVMCHECRGARLKPEARAVQVHGFPIQQFTAQTVENASTILKSFKFAGVAATIAEPLIGEIRQRLDFLRKVGLDYLTLDRAADSLSGGESQRIRLASGLGSGLVGVCYVLDEPSIGLHQRDNDRLIAALRELQQLGNSVLVVEHDEAMMREADQLIDLGPGAGRLGGRVMAQGTPAEVCQVSESLTGRYLSGAAAIHVPPQRRPANLKRSIVIEGVTTNNLKNVSATFPLGVLTCVTGVSGSGKSSLLNETFARAVERKLTGTGPKPGPHTALRGVNQIDKLVRIDQSPIGRSPRSNPATYTGIYDEIRKVFAGSREAKLRGYKASRFSFNVAGGRCETCQGQGIRKLEMNFLPDLTIPCSECGGARFNRQTLEVRYREKSIADVLAMPVDEALPFFENFSHLQRMLQCLEQVGLGYVALGQSSTTLSGGEAQRVKLATELGRTDTGSTLYLLDEPTTGLHIHDIQKLLDVLNRLVDAGNTVIVIEHNLDVIKSADWLVDLGPEGGERGGLVLAEGTPEDVAAVEGNSTGKYLRALLPG